VLRHHLSVLRRQIDRPALNDNDRTPLRWHRRRIAKHWTHAT